MRKITYEQKGFTLIELLVVIAIIGLLASVVLASLKSARTKTKDVRRIADLKQIQLAIEMYYDNMGRYPVIQAYTTDASGGCGVNWCVLESALSPYLAELPTDPLGLQNNYRYYYDGGESDDYGYGLMTRFEYSGNYAKVAEDGGWYNATSTGSYWEIGPEPAYDKSLGVNWWAD